jgi:LA2681-like HEPN
MLPRPRKTSDDEVSADRLAHSVQREDFQAKTTHLLKLARAGLVYLSFGMRREEQRRRQGGREKNKAVPMVLPFLEERWKH